MDWKLSLGKYERNRPKMNVAVTAEETTFQEFSKLFWKIYWGSIDFNKKDVEKQKPKLRHKNEETKMHNEYREAKNKSCRNKLKTKVRYKFNKRKINAEIKKMLHEGFKIFWKNVIKSMKKL